jgi:hypothetical protein
MRGKVNASNRKDCKTKSKGVEKAAIPEGNVKTEGLAQVQLTLRQLPPTQVDERRVLTLREKKGFGRWPQV